MSEVFEKEESMKLWEQDLLAKGETRGEARGEARGRDQRSQEIYERLRAANMPENQARAIAFG